MGEPFLRVIEASEAHRLFREAVRPEPLGTESVGLSSALGRVLAEDVASPVDVPGFDRSNVDGFAVRAEDTFGAEEHAPKRLALHPATASIGAHGGVEVGPGVAARIVTGAMIPRGADAVVMVEHTLVESGTVVLRRAVTPGQNVSWAGHDIARGEVVLRRGTRLTARETGTLAALGRAQVPVFRRPCVAVFSTGNEIVPPGGAMRPGLVFDSNLRIIADSVHEMGCEALELGVVPDDASSLREMLDRALVADAVVFSGGTSKGEGDMSAQVVRERATVVCHGVALKPGKPLCLAVAGRKPVVVLPGFPTSAVFTFHEFVAPVLLAMAGAPPERAGSVEATLPMRVNAEKGRAEFLLVSLQSGPNGLVAYPMAKGSGSVTSFATADGFITLGRQQEYVDSGERVSVRLLGREVRPADLVVVGSHCVGLDYLLTLLRRSGFTSKTLVVGSQGGFLAAERDECDVAGVHLCDAKGEYNMPFVKPGMRLVRGYGRMQGVVFRGVEPPLGSSLMVNRNRGSGTRALVDELLAGARPPGYGVEARSHNAVAAAVAQGRADWGVCIRPVAALYGLRFRPLREERFDFVIPQARWPREPVRAFVSLLEGGEAREGLATLGFTTV